MSACLGAVVRAPITSILMVFEMTHQFSLIPMLMIGAIASQAVSRAFCSSNFYSEVIERDGEGSKIATLSTFSKTFVNWSDPGA